MGKYISKKQLKQNAEIARKNGYDRHLFVEKIGVPLKDCGTNFCDNKDKRYKKWMKQRKKYGFDERETWNLDHSFYEWLYERLCMYKKTASKIIDLTFYKFTIDGKEYTQIELIDKMIKSLKYMLVNYPLITEDDEEWEKKRVFVMKAWPAIIQCMWW